MPAADEVEALRELNYGEKYVTCTNISYQYYYNNDANTDRAIDFAHAGCERYASSFATAAPHL